MATYINPVGGDGANSSLQDVINGITSPYPGVSSVNVNTDQVANDAYWAIAGSGYSASTMIIQLAGSAPYTTFGIFSGNKLVPLISGGTAAGGSAFLSIHGNGDVFVNNSDSGVVFAGNSFGYYISESNTGDTFYSDTSKNTDSLDHMVAFQGKGTDTVRIGYLSPGIWGTSEYVLGFEDSLGGGDQDYQDLVVMVESVAPTSVPEPATLLLLGLGLFGVAGIRRKFKK
jgi:hypothetical protein